MKLKNWIPAIIMALIIFSLSSLHGSTVQSSGLGHNSIQINGHFILYVLLCISMYKATKSLWTSALYSYIYAITDEIHQLYVPGRSFQYFDLLIDGLGIILAIIILWKSKYLLPNKLRNWLQN